MKKVRVQISSPSNSQSKNSSLSLTFEAAPSVVLNAVSNTTPALRDHSLV